MRRLAVLILAATLSACITDGTARPPERPPVAERSRAERNRDEAMGTLALRRLTDADRRAFQAVTVLVWDGNAVLTGAVTKPDQRRRAEALAAGTEGLKSVKNELLLAEERALPLFLPEADRAREVLKRLLDDPAINGTFAVRVVNGVAYLVGRVASDDDAQRAKAAAAEVRGIKWAVCHAVVAP